MKILVTGAAGQLGRAVAAHAAAAGHDVRSLDRAALDLRDHRAILVAVGAARPAVVINCAADNDVEGAEDAPARAFEVNALALRSLSRAAAEAGATLVHYSTDFVFDGRACEPYTERDRPCPQSAYASSKLAGEWFAAGAPAHYVLRVESLFGGPAARSSIDRIARALAAGQPAPVFVDRVVSPAYVDDVARATLALLDGAAPFGLYHCVNDGHATWLAVGQEIARLVGAPEALLTPVRMAELALKARRPLFAALAIDKLKRCGIDMPPWQDALARHLQLGTRRPRP